MKQFAFVAALAAAAIAVPAAAMLSVSATAPDFTLQTAQGGDVSTFHLADALKKGPVVLYFYPEAFTKGCTIEAHLFADHIDAFKSYGATVVGVSHDGIEKLKNFSTSECRSKFLVAADQDQHVAGSYDAILAQNPKYDSRTSYLIAPDGRILYAFTDMQPDKHVENLLAALKAWKEGQH